MLRLMIPLFVLAVPIFGAYLIFFTMTEVQHSERGFSSLDIEAMSTRIIVVSLASVFGILSKLALDALQIGAPRLLPFFRVSTIFFRRILSAVIICPLVILPLYSMLQELDDVILLALFAYQNGFFFQTILARGPMGEMS